MEKAPQSARRSEKVARRVAVRGMVATFRTPAAKTQSPEGTCFYIKIWYIPLHA